jgi:serine/threonine protein kinase/tetratricopeptide (TPR) repeat protein
VTPERWQQINRVLDEAWERDSTERGAFLDEIGAHDPELRAKVEELLAADANPGEFLVAAPVGLAKIRQAALGQAIDGCSMDVSESSNLAGTRVGRYTIQGLIGRGGMGDVYRAVREYDFRMQVAIKLLKRGTDTEAALVRFRAERQILAGLQHPNIAHMLDGGATEAGLPYFVMEYVDGTPFLEYGAPLPVRQRLGLFRQVCSAVQYAHENLIVHRDIKPANILVTTDGVPKLLDFGIAKLLDPATDGATAASTTAGVRLLTPDYASPEQVLGKPITPATDVYSLGTVLYELLTGERAHRITSYSAGEIEREVLREPKRPSAVVKDLDADLDNIVLKALRREPERRYASVQDLSDDLERFLKDLPVRARRETAIYRSRKFVKRNRALTAALAVGVLGVAVFLTGLVRISMPDGATPTVRTIAVLPLEDLSHDPGQQPFTDGITDTLIGDLGKVSSLRVISRDSVMRYKDVRKTVAAIARELNVNALVSGSVQRSENRVQVSLQLKTGPMDRVLWTETYDRDLRDVNALQSDAAKAIAREIQIRLTPQEEALVSPARPVSQPAYEAYLKGQYELYKHTTSGFRKSIEHFKEAIDIDSAYAPAWAALADGYYELSGLTLPPSEAIPKAKAAALKALAIDPTLAEPQVTLAQIQSQCEWDWANAEARYHRLLKLNPSHAPGHAYYAWYLAEQGRTGEAIKEATEAYRLDPLQPIRATNLAWFYYLARRHDEAIAQFRKILELDPDLTTARYSLGNAYLAKRMFEPAIAELLKAHAINDSSAFLGYAYAISGKREEARRFLQRLAELSRHQYVDPIGFGTIYLGLGENDRAFGWFEKAFQDRSEDLLLLKVDPRMDSARSDPRYKSLVRRIGLPP